VKEIEIIRNNPAKYPDAHAYLEPMEIPVVIHTGLSPRERQRLFVDHQDVRPVPRNQRFCLDAIDVMQDIEDGRGDDVSNAAMRDAVLTKLWEQMGFDENSPFYDRVELVGGSRRVRGRKVVLTELVRTTKPLWDILCRTTDLDIEEQSFDELVETLQSVVSGFWSHITTNLPEVCNIENCTKYLLMSQKGVKATNEVLTCFMRYARERRSGQFIKQYGENLTLAETLEEPLTILLGGPGSYYRKGSDEFWAAGGPTGEFGGGSKDCQKMTHEKLWPALKFPNAHHWADYTLPKSKLKKTRNKKK
jgi:hypothetical protein